MKSGLIESGTEIVETAEIDDVIDVVDVLYLTRIQKERFSV